jgi:chemotaxis protein CheX
VERAPPHPTEGVVALIGLAGSWVGTGSISCSASFACRISAQMLMTKIESVGEEVLDAVAEVTNMIIGNVKTGLEEHLGPMGLSIPTVVYGRDFTARSAGEGEWTVFPFFDGEDRLDVRICLVPNRKPVLQVRPGYSHPSTLQG